MNKILTLLMGLVLMTISLNYCYAQDGPAPWQQPQEQPQGFWNTNPQRPSVTNTNIQRSSSFVVIPIYHLSLSVVAELLNADAVIWDNENGGGNSGGYGGGNNSGNNNSGYGGGNSNNSRSNSGNNSRSNSRNNSNRNSY